MEAFKPFGHVVQAFADGDTTPKGVKVTPANQGSANKFHKLAPIISNYPPSLTSATSGLSVYRCLPLGFDFLKDYNEKGPGWEIKLLERHPYTNQAFVPMGVGSGEGLKGPDALSKTGRMYLVVVAKTGADEKPDLGTLKAFIAGAGQAIVYDVGVWRKSTILLPSFGFDHF